MAPHGASGGGDRNRGWHRIVHRGRVRVAGRHGRRARPRRWLRRHRPGAVRRDAQKLDDEHGRIDVLCNNAGIGAVGDVTQADPDDWPACLRGQRVRRWRTCRRPCCPSCAVKGAGRSSTPARWSPRSGSSSAPSTARRKARCSGSPGDGGRRSRARHPRQLRVTGDRRRPVGAQADRAERRPRRHAGRARAPPTARPPRRVPKRWPRQSRSWRPTRRSRPARSSCSTVASRASASSGDLFMTRITGMVVHDVRFPTSRPARRVGRDEPRPRLLGGLRRAAHRRPGAHRVRHDVHHRSGQRPVLRGDRGVPRPRRRPRPRRARGRPRRRSGATSPATASCVGSVRRRASCTSRPPRSSNAVWDLLRRRAGKPLWKYLADLTAEQIVAARRLPPHHRRAHRPTTRSTLLRGARRRRRPSARRSCAPTGYPAYITSAGWLGYPDDQIRAGCQRGARRRLDAPQDEGRPRPSTTTSAARAHPRGDRARPPAA